MNLSELTTGRVGPTNEAIEGFVRSEVANLTRQIDALVSNAAVIGSDWENGDLPHHAALAYLEGCSSAIKRSIDSLTVGAETQKAFSQIGTTDMLTGEPK